MYIIEKLEKSEIKDQYKRLVEPILNGDTGRIYPTDNSFTKWANLQDNIEVFNRSATGLRLEHGLMVADKIQSVIDELLDNNSLKIV